MDPTFWDAYENPSSTRKNIVILVFLGRLEVYHFGPSQYLCLFLDE